MLRKTLLTHTALWFVVFLGWLLATRQYHPTPLIAVLATALLVTASAVAVYLNRRVAQGRSWLRYFTLLVAALTTLDIAAVLSIQRLYDLLWGPDPHRFGFWFNLGSDGFIILLHVVVWASVERVWGWWRGGRERREAAAHR